MNKKLLLFPALLLGALSSMSAAPLTGDSLSVGPTVAGTANSVYGPNCAAIGVSNYNNGSRALVVGTSNSTSVSSNGVIIGTSNSGPYGAVNGLIVGVSNGSSGQFNSSMVLGTLNAGVSSSATSTDSLIVGNTNTMQVESGLVVGKNNYAVGQKYVLGQGLIADTANVLLVTVGKYNATPTATQLFVIGNGTAAGSRKNALEVYQDGTVKLPKRQGDLKMGVFGPAGADN